MGLESSNFAGFSSLSNCVNGISNTNLGLDRFKRLVKSDQHTGVHRQGEVVQEIMVLATDEGVHVSAGVDSRQ
jgi:hypothetical protein